MKCFEQELNLNYTLLDLIDLTPYISNTITMPITDIISRIEKDYYNHVFDNYIYEWFNAFEDGELFNYLDEYDFVKYLVTRYNVTWKEEYITTYYISSAKDSDI